MIIRGTPKDLEHYLLVDDEFGNELQNAGFQPRYIDELYLYFYLTKELEDYIGKAVI